MVEPNSGALFTHPASVFIFQFGGGTVLRPPGWCRALTTPMTWLSLVTPTPEPQQAEPATGLDEVTKKDRCRGLCPGGCPGRLQTARRPRRPKSRSSSKTHIADMRGQPAGRRPGNPHTPGPHPVVLRRSIWSAGSFSAPGRIRFWT